MKIIILALVLSTNLFAQSLTDKIDKVIPILIEVESNGDLKAIGDGGRAKGQLQIWDVVIKDVNRKFNTNYKHDDAFYYHNSCEICFLYLYRWGSWYEKKYDKKMSIYDLGRLWNSGPYWFTKLEKTNGYVNKMRKVIK